MAPDGVRAPPPAELGAAGGRRHSQLSRRSMHSCSSMGYLARSMSQATVDVILPRQRAGEVSRREVGARHPASPAPTPTRGPPSSKGGRAASGALSARRWPRGGGGAWTAVVHGKTLLALPSGIAAGLPSLRSSFQMPVWLSRGGGLGRQGCPSTRPALKDSVCAFPPTGQCGNRPGLPNVLTLQKNLDSYINLLVGN